MRSPTATFSVPSDQLVGEYLVWLHEVRGRKGATVYSYEGVLTRFVEHLGSTHVATATPEDVQAFMLRPRPGRAKGGAGAAATVSKDATIISTLYDYLVARGVATYNPAKLTGRPVVRNRQPRAIDDDVWRKLWASTSLPDEARVVLGAGFFAGLRRFEITQLAPHHFFVPAQRLVAFPRKGGGDDTLDYGECVGIIADALPHLLPHRDAFLGPLHAAVEARSGAARLLPWADGGNGPTDTQRFRHGLESTYDIDPQKLSKKLQTWLKGAGFHPTAFTAHALRHSFVTNLLRAGVPIELVSDLANHSDIGITMRYVKSGTSRIREWRMTARIAAETSRLVVEGH